MSTMNLTLIGMYNYDSHLFDELTLPEEIDKQLFINNLLFKSGEFELLYPSADFMKPMIKVWGMKWYPTFEKWLEGQKATWNPIENYDRYEESDDTNNATDTHEHDEMNDLSIEHKGKSHNESMGSGQDTTGVTGSGSTESQVSAYDSSTYQPATKDIQSSGSDSSSYSETSGEVDAHDESSDYHEGSNHREGSDTHEGSNHHESHIHGNIGVTQASDMLRSFYNIAEWNLMDHMADVFIQEFCIRTF